MNCYICGGEIDALDEVYTDDEGNSHQSWIDRWFYEILPENT